MPKKQQVWKCPRCGETYTAALPAAAVLCPNSHLAQGRGRSGKQEMELIVGELPRPRKGHG